MCLTLVATPQDVLTYAARRPRLPKRAVPVLCSLTISSRVAELCRKHGIGYLDAAGNSHIPALFPGGVTRCAAALHERLRFMTAKDSHRR